MELGAKAFEERLNLASQGGWSPRGELAPMVLGMLPKNFDEIEFRAVGRQIKQEEFAIGLPSLDDDWIDVFMYRSVIHCQESIFFGVTRLSETINERDDMVSANVLFANLEMQFAFCTVQGPHDIDSLAAKTGVGHVWQAQW